MMRKMVGWVRLEGEMWEITMRRMKHRVNRALVQRPTMWWTQRLAKYIWNFAVRVKSASDDTWLAQSTKWKPDIIDDVSCAFLPNRCRGVPRLKWDDSIRKFCRIYFNCCWCDVPMAFFTARSDEFIKYFSGHDV